MRKEKFLNALNNKTCNVDKWDSEFNKFKIDPKSMNSRQRKNLLIILNNALSIKAKSQKYATPSCPTPSCPTPRYQTPRYQTPKYQTTIYSVLETNPLDNIRFLLEKLNENQVPGIFKPSNNNVLTNNPYKVLKLIKPYKDTRSLDYFTLNPALDLSVFKKACEDAYLLLLREEVLKYAQQKNKKFKIAFLFFYGLNFIALFVPLALKNIFPQNYKTLYLEILLSLFGACNLFVLVYNSSASFKNSIDKFTCEIALGYQKDLGKKHKEKTINIP